MTDYAEKKYSGGRKLKMKPSPPKVESQPVMTKIDNSGNSHTSLEFKKGG